MKYKELFEKLRPFVDDKDYQDDEVYIMDEATATYFKVIAVSDDGDIVFDSEK